MYKKYCLKTKLESEPLERVVFFKIFEERQPIALYRLAAQQQTYTSRGLKFDLFYPQFSSKFIELNLKL